jgi:hypothetical protein
MVRRGSNPVAVVASRVPQSAGAVAVAVEVLTIVDRRPQLAVLTTEV